MPAGPATDPAEPPRRRGSRIREVPAGYDLDPLPIKVPVRDGESVVSWLRRVSWRYDTPARTLMRNAGTPTALTGTSKVAPRLRNNRELLDRLGLAAADVERLFASTPLGAATTNYLKAFHTTTPSPRPWSRYCPTCLTGPDPYWRQDWQSPLLAICPTHDTYLHQACPSCLQHPQYNPAWLSRPVELWRCPAPLVTFHNGPSGRDRRPTCTYDLRTADSLQAAPAEAAAQRLLLGGADDPIHTSTACGVTVTGRIGFDAMLDLLDAATKGTPFDLAHQPVDVAARLAEAAQVLTQPTLDAAAVAASRLLSYSGPHAPLGPPSRFTAASYNPLLAAVQVHGVRDQLGPADQLMFRTGHSEPRYPATLTPRNRRRLRLPDHHPYLAEPDGQRLPQLIWPDLFPDLFADRPSRRNALVRRAVLAMALAKVGSTRTWTEIASDLDLPPTLAADVGAVLHRSCRQGRWPATLTTLDTLASRLQAEPAPVDYAARRCAGRDVAALRRALHVARQTHPTDTHADVVVRHFWELFTGGDVAYAPEPLRIPAHTARYRRHRNAAARTLDQDRPLLQTALHELGRLSDVGPFTGPLAWTPVEPAALYTDDSVRLLIGQGRPTPDGGAGAVLTKPTP